MDWNEVFGIHFSLAELVLRGSAVYLALYTMLRVVIKRQSGVTGVADLLVLVLMADAAQNAMAGSYTTVTEGVILVLTIVGWSYLLDFLAFHSRTLSRIIRPSPLPLVKDGRVLPHNLRRELITRDELLSQLREQGVDDLSRVKTMFMEEDGQFSVIQKDETATRGRRRDRSV